MTNEAIKYQTRPEWTPAIRGRRAEVWHWRHCSAWDLAAIVCGPDAVTIEEYNAAAKLLDSIQRYALADAAEWERENSNEWYCNSAHHRDREKMLFARRARLAERLARYNLQLVNYGLYPSIIDDNGNDKHMLHYFD